MRTLLKEPIKCIITRQRCYGIDELFTTSKQNIYHHIASTLEDRELDPNSVVKNYFTTESDGKEYEVTFYTLEMILVLDIN